MDFDSAVALLRRLIATPSPSREEGAAADIMEAELRSMGYKPHRKGNNVWAEASARDDSKPTILLDAHIDTVRPSAAWSRDPYDACIEDGRLYGLGSNDTGGSVVSLLAAFDFLAQRPQPYNLIYLASAEEEVTGAGGVRAGEGQCGGVPAHLRDV